MSKRAVILALVSFLGTVTVAPGFGAKMARQALLRDGFVLSGVDGILIGPDSNDVWLFEFASDVNDYRVVAKAGTRLELLRSSALERMAADVQVRSAPTYQLWDSRVTTYKGRNFIFPTYFVPLSKTMEPQSQTSQPQQEQPGPGGVPSARQRRWEPAIEGPNDILAIPQEIMEKLRARRIARPEKFSRFPKLTDGTGDLALPKESESERDSVLAGRTAFLAGQDDGELVFFLDAFGRNVQRVSLELLPCEALELTEGEQFAVSELLPFKIAGIMTKYKGRNYLLLHRATRVYSHGNFRTPILQ